MTSDEFAERPETLIAKAHAEGFCYAAIKDALKAAIEALDESAS
jgi:hypothetical protein